jgi:hypothetical protein
VRSTSYIVNNPRLKRRWKVKISLDLDVPLSGKNPGHSVSFSTGHFRPCDMRREGSESQRSATWRKKPSGPFFGTCMGGASGDIRMVLFSSIPRRCGMPGATVWFPFCWGTTSWLQAKSYQLNVPSMMKSVSRGTKKLDYYSQEKSAR